MNLNNAVPVNIIAYQFDSNASRPSLIGPLFGMDVVQAVSGYVSKMVSSGENATGSSTSKMKILLLDSETVRSEEN